MNGARFDELTTRYAGLRIVVLGDLCLDRYLEIDPARAEVSIETGLPVHNVVRVRSQPGAAGTIVSNLVALGIGTVIPVGVVGQDGDGFELLRALTRSPQVATNYLIHTAERRTFTYMKPLLIAPGKPLQELSRLDIKNWTPTPAGVETEIIRRTRAAAEQCDAIVVLDQVDDPGTGVVTKRLLEVLGELHEARPNLPMMADSRRSLRDFPPLMLKMNRSELTRLAGWSAPRELDEEKAAAAALTQQQGQPVFVTLAERGMMAAEPSGQVDHIGSHPVRGEIDVVGAGDAVTANLIAALAAGATPKESLELANAAASIVIHQLGTTGTAGVEQLRSVLSP